MSVRQSLLAILGQGPCYGYQLRAEFDRRTGSTWPLNVGQIYNTLDRLERDGLVRKGETDGHGHVYYEITDAGSAEVETWLAPARAAVFGYAGRARDQARRRRDPARSRCRRGSSGTSARASRARLEELTRGADGVDRTRTRGSRARCSWSTR